MELVISYMFPSQDRDILQSWDWFQFVKFGSIYNQCESAASH
jgi:hypothetical protein